MENKEFDLPHFVKVVKEICKDLELSEEDILSRARLMYLISNLSNLDAITILVTEMQWQKREQEMKDYNTYKGFTGGQKGKED